MTKAELIKSLEPFNDNDEVIWSAHYSIYGYGIKEVRPNLKNEILLVIGDDEDFPDRFDLRDMAQYILDNKELKWYEKKLLEEIINEF